MPGLKRGSRRGAGRRAGAAMTSRRRPAPPTRRPPTRAAAPRATVLVHPECLHAIADATAAAAGRFETGGPLIGTVQRSWSGDGWAPSLIVSLLATVPPGPALHATAASVSLGRRADGERAASALRWWRAVTGLDLVHLGDWHKHDSHSPKPSAGDHATAREMRAETATPLWLAAIAVGERAEKGETGAERNRARILRSVADCEHVRFYRAAAGRGLAPVRIRVEADALPGLPALPWHVADPARFAAECRLLKGAGFSVGIEAGDSGGRPGLTLRLERNGKPPLTVVTNPDYPAVAPWIGDGEDKPVRKAAKNGAWSAGRFLVDLVEEAH